MLSSHNIGLLLFFFASQLHRSPNISQWSCTADVNCRRVLGLKILLQFAKSRQACGFALALPRPRSRGPLDEGAAASSFSDNRYADVRPLKLQVNVLEARSRLLLGRSFAYCRKASACGDRQQVRAPGGPKESRTHTSRAMTKGPHWCTSSFMGRRKSSTFWTRLEDPRVSVGCFSGPERPALTSLDYFQRNSTSSMMHTISPSRHSKEEEFDQLHAHFSQVEPSSFGDLTTQIKEETGALGRLGSVGPRRMPTSCARGRISLACWLKTDTHIQNHTMKFCDRKRSTYLQLLRCGSCGEPQWSGRGNTRKKNRDEDAAPSTCGHHRLLAPKRDLSQLGHCRTLVSPLL